MFASYACRSPEHTIARRQFLGGVAGGVGAAALGLGAMTRPAAAAELAKQQKRIVVFWMAGGLSQLESWDPKPGTRTGGPFRAIPTSVPGVELCELLPQTAKQMHHLCLVRGVNTSEDDHGKGAYLMVTGRRESPALDYPRLGAVAAKALAPENSPLPGHIQITPGGGGGRSNDAAYLGPKFASVVLGGGQPPQNTSPAVAAAIDAQRNDFRRKANERFLSRRRTAQTDLYTYSYEQALQLMERRDAFDISKEPAKAQEQYGDHDLGRQCLLARRLLEQGVTFIQISHSNYDTHNENFDFHIEQLGEFDQAYATFIDDLHQRGMLDSTLVIVMSEFGRTPNINLYYGRDHWSKAWSVALAGCGVKRGIAYGKTNDQGTEVVDGHVDHGNLFHTYLSAVGLDSTATFDIGGREMPMADPSSKPIDAVLA
ncbi:MAG: DUF1501 domain-containing protein [Planctomycetota bacterium]|nr:MAG: DUF1501 domain-containing protein [Planctomycetota bacterium]